MAPILEKLTRRIRQTGSLLCIGIDPPPHPTSDVEFPDPEFHSFLKATFDKCAKLIAQTAEFACCFKPNVAFFEPYGIRGLDLMRQICWRIPKGIPIILDTKRSADLKSGEAYAFCYFWFHQADCVTLDPYMGLESVLPFIRVRGRGAFVVCKSSNPLGDDLQAIRTCEPVAMENNPKLYMAVAKMCQTAKNFLEPELTREGGVVGLVVGATRPHEMAKLRTNFEDLWILAPGVGTQGGDLEATIRAGIRSDGLGLIINIGRAIYEAPDVREAAAKFHSEISDVLGRIENEKRSNPGLNDLD